LENSEQGVGHTEEIDVGDILNALDLGLEHLIQSILPDFDEEVNPTEDLESLILWPLCELFAQWTVREGGDASER
jgi:hypothetical protein